MAPTGSSAVRRNSAPPPLETPIICGDVREYITVCNIQITWFLDQITKQRNMSGFFKRYDKRLTEDG